MASTTAMTIVTTTTTASKSKLRFSGGALKFRQCRSHHSGHTRAYAQRQAHTGATSSLTHPLIYTLTLSPPVEFIQRSVCVRV